MDRNVDEESICSRVNARLATRETSLERVVVRRADRKPEGARTAWY